MSDHRGRSPSKSQPTSSNPILNEWLEKHPNPPPGVLYPPDIARRGSSKENSPCKSHQRSPAKRTPSKPSPAKSSPSRRALSPASRHNMMPFADYDDKQKAREARDAELKRRDDEFRRTYGSYSNESVEQEDDRENRDLERRADKLKQRERRREEQALSEARLSLLDHSGTTGDFEQDDVSIPGSPQQNTTFSVSQKFILDGMKKKAEGDEQHSTPSKVVVGEVNILEKEMAAFAMWTPLTPNQPQQMVTVQKVTASSSTTTTTFDESGYAVPLRRSVAPHKGSPLNISSISPMKGLSPARNETFSIMKSQSPASFDHSDIFKSIDSSTSLARQSIGRAEELLEQAKKWRSPLKSLEQEHCLPEFGSRQSLPATGGNVTEVDKARYSLASGSIASDLKQKNRLTMEHVVEESDLVSTARSPDKMSLNYPDRSQNLETSQSQAETDAQKRHSMVIDARVDLQLNFAETTDTVCKQLRELNEWHSKIEATKGQRLSDVLESLTVPSYTDINQELQSVQTPEAQAGGSRVRTPPTIVKRPQQKTPETILRRPSLIPKLQTAVPIYAPNPHEQSATLAEVDLTGNSLNTAKSFVEHKQTQADDEVHNPNGEGFVPSPEAMLDHSIPPNAAVTPVSRRYSRRSIACSPREHDRSQQTTARISHAHRLSTAKIHPRASIRLEHVPTDSELAIRKNFVHKFEKKLELLTTIEHSTIGMQRSMNERTSSDITNLNKQYRLSIKNLGARSSQRLREMKDSAKDYTVTLDAFERYYKVRVDALKSEIESAAKKLKRQKLEDDEWLSSNPSSHDERTKKQKPQLPVYSSTEDRSRRSSFGRQMVAPVLMPSAEMNRTLHADLWFGANDAAANMSPRSTGRSSDISTAQMSLNKYNEAFPSLTSTTRKSGRESLTGRSASLLMAQARAQELLEEREASFRRSEVVNDATTSPISTPRRHGIERLDLSVLDDVAEVHNEYAYEGTTGSPTIKTVPSLSTLHPPSRKVTIEWMESIESPQNNQSPEKDDLAAAITKEDRREQLLNTSDTQPSPTDENLYDVKTPPRTVVDDRDVLINKPIDSAGTGSPAASLPLPSKEQLEKSVVSQEILDDSGDTTLEGSAVITPEEPSPKQESAVDAFVPSLELESFSERKSEILNPSSDRSVAGTERAMGYDEIEFMNDQLGGASSRSVEYEIQGVEESGNVVESSHGEVANDEDIEASPLRTEQVEEATASSDDKTASSVPVDFEPTQTSIDDAFIPESGSVTAESLEFVATSQQQSARSSASVKDVPSWRSGSPRTPRMSSPRSRLSADQLPNSGSPRSFASPRDPASRFMTRFVSSPLNESQSKLDGSFSARTPRRSLTPRSDGTTSRLGANKRSMAIGHTMQDLMDRFLEDSMIDLEESAQPAQEEQTTVERNVLPPIALPSSSIQSSTMATATTTTTTEVEAQDDSMLDDSLLISFPVRPPSTTVSSYVTAPTTPVNEVASVEGDKNKNVNTDSAAPSLMHLQDTPRVSQYIKEDSIDDDLALAKVPRPITPISDEEKFERLASSLEGFEWRMEQAEQFVSRIYSIVQYEDEEGIKEAASRGPFKLPILDDDERDMIQGERMFVWSVLFETVLNCGKSLDHLREMVETDFNKWLLDELAAYHARRNHDDKKKTGYNAISSLANHFPFDDPIEDAVMDIINWNVYKLDGEFPMMAGEHYKTMRQQTINDVANISLVEAVEEAMNEVLDRTELQHSNDGWS